MRKDRCVYKLHFFPRLLCVDIIYVNIKKLILTKLTDRL